MTTWNFSESLGQERLRALHSPPPFAKIAHSVASTMRIQCVHVDFCDEAYGFKRLVGCVVINRALFDLFFNSQNGYRGRYFRSPEKGLQMNATLLKLLAPLLLAFQRHNKSPESILFDSLHALSAKCWLAEVGKGFCQKCEGDWSAPKDDSPEILNGRWEIASAPNSRFGRKAPSLEKFRVMGAFVSEAGEEHVAKKKLRRAKEIHNFGWS
jgi:hypothetical protein